MNVKSTEVKATVKNGKMQTVKKVADTKAAAQPKKVDIFEHLKKDEAQETKKEQLKEQTKELIATFRPSAEERIKNMAKFQILTKKYDVLKEKKEELEKFKISSDGTQEKIFFENSQGYKLEVSNSNIIDEMLSLAENTLNNILQTTEEQVQNFVI
ncbi:MAG: hypothetical protein ACSHXA_07580 [Polaribacter sp.]|uniref:hypothetical protein n=1 Tax=Polaribacter sp. TaxID=1920175 RepID=UPI003EFAC90A